MNASTLQPSNASTSRVVGYVRGSTEEQLNTLEAQENQIRAYCAYKNLELVRVFVDQGESGSTSFYERPAACDMLTQMSDLGATGIVITKLDRGFRNALDCLFTLENLTARGIGLHLLDIQLEPDTPVGKLLVTMLAAIAEFENKRRSERQMAAFAVMKSKGQRCGTIPYGWVQVHVVVEGQATGPETLAPDEEEQRVLRQIVYWIEVEHMAISKIARLLNEAGTPTKQGGKKWFPGTVSSVYKHRRIAETPTQKAA
jgi:site-specific DNA recombinase